jgi:DNA-binding NarL/FixJ family response regulator
VEHLLRGLDNRARAVCEMRLQGYEVDEIAAALKLSTATINRKLRHIKDRMKYLWPELPE